MPGQDRTGPMGQGPLTGRGLGPCGGGFRCGVGRGFKRMQFMQPRVITESEEKEMLNRELKVIEEEKKEIEQRLKNFK